MKNNLINDLSPYLQQHKNNPVHWQTWNEQTLQLAKKEKKPILLSVGYASCHWCHVMAHESFEDDETAKIMNKYFINIKVDREERPDIDFVFQSSYQLFNNSGGGWPLTMFLDENAVPFMGGTYFPKKEQHGLPSFKSVLNKIGKVYSIEREKITEQRNLITKSLELKKNAVQKQDLEPFLESIIINLDPIKGGYKGSPKFPTFNVFESLLYFFQKTKKKNYLEPVEIILQKLCSQGIYDHVDGGISRYTVDENWLIPHFEKMLYDNAQFVSILSKFSKLKNEEYYKDKIIQTINCFNENYINPKNGLLGSAYDADSDGVEGKFHTFLFTELNEIKGIENYFDIEPEGNWEGKIILREKKIPPFEIVQKLKSIRNKKNKPFFDDKTQLDLNCLWISSLIHAHSVLPKKNYLFQAEELYKKIELKFMRKKLFHSSIEDTAFLEDYAYMINALNDLGESTLNSKYKLKAKEFCDEVIEDFYLKEKSIFQKNRKSSNDLFFNPIDISDHTIPNGNSIMLINLIKLGYKKESEELAKSLNAYLNIYKSYMTSALRALDFFNEKSNGKNCNDQGCEI